MPLRPSRVTADVSYTRTEESVRLNSSVPTHSRDKLEHLRLRLRGVNVLPMEVVPQERYDRRRAWQGTGGRDGTEKKVTELP